MQQVQVRRLRMERCEVQIQHEERAVGEVWLWGATRAPQLGAPAAMRPLVRLRLLHLRARRVFIMEAAT